jgi:hypothetical protein
MYHATKKSQIFYIHHISLYSVTPFSRASCPQSCSHNLQLRLDPVLFCAAAHRATPPAFLRSFAAASSSAPPVTVPAPPQCYDPIPGRRDVLRSPAHPLMGSGTPHCSTSIHCRGDDLRAPGRAPTGTLVATVC